MYKFGKCIDKDFYVKDFSKDLRNLFKKISLPKKKKDLYITGKFEVGRTLEIENKYNDEISSNFSYLWESINTDDEWVEVSNDNLFIVPNELLGKKLRLTAIYEKGDISKKFRSRPVSIKSSEVIFNDLINSDFEIKERGNNTLRSILGFNGNTYKNKLTFYINKKNGDQKLDTGLNLKADDISLGEELFIESVFNKIDNLIDIDFERVYSPDESLIDIYSSDLTGSTLGITYIDYGIKNGEKYFQSDVVFSVSKGNLLSDFEGLSSDTAYTIVHELAHALGMRHPGDDPNGNWHTSEDTVMSYNFDNSSFAIPNFSPVDEIALLKMWGKETNFESEKLVATENNNFDKDYLEKSKFKYSSSSLDIDGDGIHTQLGDGLMIVRKLFTGAFKGEDLLNKAVSINSKRNSDEIHEFLENNIEEGLYDVDKDGKTTALGDGLLILRSFNRNNFNGENLIKGCLSINSPYYKEDQPWLNILNNVDMLETYDNMIET